MIKKFADSCQCMAKPLQYCKVFSLQLIKINENKLEFCPLRFQREREIREKIGW